MIRLVNISDGQTEVAFAKLNYQRPRKIYAKEYHGNTTLIPVASEAEINGKISKYEEASKP